jgi:hypothetical protein
MLRWVSFIKIRTYSCYNCSTQRLLSNEQDSRTCKIQQRPCGCPPFLARFARLWTSRDGNWTGELGWPPQSKYMHGNIHDLPGRVRILLHLSGRCTGRIPKALWSSNESRTRLSCIDFYRLVTGISIDQIPWLCLWSDSTLYWPRTGSCGCCKGLQSQRGQSSRSSLHGTCWNSSSASCSRARRAVHCRFVFATLIGS